MSLKLNVVTVELSLGSERHDVSMQLEKKTLVAQGQEMTIKWVLCSYSAIWTIDAGGKLNTLDF
jgi:hypothetical protein